MVAKTMLFGPIGRQVGIPWPMTGMTTDTNLLTETTDLLSGEQSVWRAPLTYKSFNMNWSGGAAALQPLLDVYRGLYGRGPYYITDPIAGIQGNNLLTYKWASPQLLQHVANGWSTPTVTGQANTPEQQQITFTGNSDDSDEAPFNAVIPCVPSQPLYYKAWGTQANGGSIRVYTYSRAAAAWSLKGTYLPTLEQDSPAIIVSTLEAAAGDIVAVKLVPYVPDGGSLTLQHLDLAVNDYRSYTPYLYGTTGVVYPALTLYPSMTLYPTSGSGVPQGTPGMFRAGTGIGPVQFTGNMGGKLTSAVIDRIGLSVDLREVARDPNNR